MTKEQIIDFLEWMNRNADENPMILETDNADIAQAYLGSIGDGSLIPQPTTSDTAFCEALRLLRDLADLQNGAPLERYRKEWEDTMAEVYAFLHKPRPYLDPF